MVEKITMFEETKMGILLINDANWQRIPNIRLFQEAMEDNAVHK